MPLLLFTLLAAWWQTLIISLLVCFNSLFSGSPIPPFASSHTLYGEKYEQTCTQLCHLPLCVLDMFSVFKGRKHSYVQSWSQLVSGLSVGFSRQIPHFWLYLEQKLVHFFFPPRKLSDIPHCIKNYKCIKGFAFFSLHQLLYHTVLALAEFLASKSLWDVKVDSIWFSW